MSTLYKTSPLNVWVRYMYVEFQKKFNTKYPPLLLKEVFFMQALSFKSI